MGAEGNSGGHTGAGSRHVGDPGLRVTCSHSTRGEEISKSMLVQVLVCLLDPFLLAGSNPAVQ